MVDLETGAIFANFTRFAEPGSKYTFLTLIVSDGLDVSHVSVSIRWGNSNEVDRPIESVFHDEEAFTSMGLLLPAYFSSPLSVDAAFVYG